MKRESIYFKLQDKDYVDNLSDAFKHKIEVCQLLLNEEELKSMSSIQTAYQIAKDRFVEEILSKVNPEMAIRAKEFSIPIFSVIDIIKRYSDEDHLNR